jgi:hypothetical protein
VILGIRHYPVKGFYGNSVFAHGRSHIPQSGFRLRSSFFHKLTVLQSKNAVQAGRGRAYFA